MTEIMFEITFYLSTRQSFLNRLNLRSCFRKWNNG